MAGIKELDLHLNADGQATIVDGEVPSAFLALAHIENQMLAHNTHDRRHGSIRRADGVVSVQNQGARG